ncbi:MAG: hypothetical protein AAF683_04075 [Pseudomonadota bacterium]
MHEVEHALGQAAVLGQGCFNDSPHDGVRERLLSTEVRTVLVRPLDDRIPRHADAFDSGCERATWGKEGERLLVPPAANDVRRLSLSEAWLVHKGPRRTPKFEKHCHGAERTAP